MLNFEVNTGNIPMPFKNEQVHSNLYSGRLYEFREFLLQLEPA